MKREQPVGTQPNGPDFVPLRAQMGWLVPLFLLCLAIFAYEFAAARNSNVPTARLAGQVFVVALFVSMGLTMLAGIFLRPFSSRHGGYELKAPKTIAFLALFSSFLGGAISGASYGRSQEVVAISSVVNALARFRRESEDDERMPVRTSVFTAREPRATGEFGDFERLLLGMGARMEADRNEYLEQMDAIAWDSVLDPARIERDPSLAETRAIVRQVKAIVDKQQARVAAVIRDIRQEIKKLPFSDDYRRRMLAGFDDSMARSNAPEILRLDRRSVDQIGNLVEILASSQYGVGWTVHDGAIRFYNDDDMNKYNAQMEALLQTVARHEELISEHAEAAAKR